MEPVIGIAAEYNPFHKGHEYQIRRSRELLGDGAVVCVMSGSFVQRGEPAVFRKHARAEAAVRSGADLVLELPLPWALSSAEGFARGCVGILGALGVVTHMSFGAECGETGKLSALAAALLDPAMDAAIREELTAGDTYAAARQRALQRLVGGELAELIRAPNNILGVEYCRAILEQHLAMEPLAIERIGAGHDSNITTEGPVSASALRLMLQDWEDISGLLPEGSAEVIEEEIRQGRGPVMTDMLEAAVVSRLRRSTEADFAALPDAAEGLENRLFRAAQFEPGMDEMLAAAATKRYPLSRLRRMLLSAALGLQKGMADGVPPYARVLAANEAGLTLLNKVNGRSSIPVLTKPAAVRELDERAQRIFEITAAAEDLYALGYTARQERRGGSDWRQSPIIIKE